MYALSELNYLAILVTAVVIFVIGAIWYSVLFGRAWTAAHGYTPEQLEGMWSGMARAYGLSFLCYLVLSLVLALSGSFVQLALLSVVTRLLSYIGTSVSVLVLRRRHADHPGALRLPGGPAIPLLATALSLALLASASVANLLAAAVALAVGSVIYLFRRKPA